MMSLLASQGKLRQTFAELLIQLSSTSSASNLVQPTPGGFQLTFFSEFLVYGMRFLTPCLTLLMYPGLVTSSNSERNPSDGVLKSYQLLTLFLTPNEFFIDIDVVNLVSPS
ncbi:unnamed protein product [Schistosoma bovis]|nr:unnamed protein product [Schistosoma bovis]